MDRSEINVEPVHDEFFKAQDLADALIRESIQNSLDARRGSSRVRVHMRLLAGADAIPRERLAPYFDGLDVHLNSVAPEMTGSWPAPSEPVSVLILEDYGTRGLSGDPSVDPEIEIEAEEKNDFFFFWRNVGRSMKGEHDRGRWGLGKAVFPISSRIRTIFGLTHRSSDERRLLLGQSVLRTHVLDGQRIYPYGFFGRFARDGFPQPVEDPRFIEQFCRDFGVSRDEPGLSIVMPYFRENELAVDQLMHSTVDQYFFPIVRGDLQVTIEQGSRIETISARTISDVAAGMGDAELQKMCELTRWAVTDGATSLVPAQPFPESAAPAWTNVARGESKWQPFTVSELDSLRERLEAGDRIAAEFRIAVKRRKRLAHSGFRIFMEKDDALSRGEHAFIRRGITIPDIPRTARYSRDKPLRALLVVDDDALSTLLGDAENPAHSDWSERADKVRELYDHGASTVRFVKNAISQLGAMLLRPAEGRSRDLLRDLFFVDRDEGRETEGKSEGDTATEEGESPQQPDVKVELQPKNGASIAARGHGFTIRGSGDPDAVGQSWEARLAYRTRHGNPFHRYAISDFDVSRDLKLRIRGARIDLAEQNILRFVPTSPDYEIVFDGFDAYRDLVVRVERVSGDAEEA